MIVSVIGLTPEGADRTTRSGPIAPLPAAPVLLDYLTDRSSDQVQSPSYGLFTKRPLVFGVLHWTNRYP